MGFMNFLPVQGHRIEYEFIRVDRDAPVIVFLHEGLGSHAMWRDFPARLARAARCSALVYSRYGHGNSDALAAPRRPDFMHEEGMRALPELLDKLGVERPILFGHSDGGSIALIYAAAAGRPVTGLIVEAPHVMVEDLSISSIQESKRIFETTDLRQKLARYHAHPESTFRGWNDIWLAPEFRQWSIEEYLPRLACPVLAIQGEDDEYGTMRQVERIAESAADVQVVKLAKCGHTPHRDQPEAVIEAAVRFVRKCLE